MILITFADKEFQNIQGVVFYLVSQQEPLVSGELFQGGDGPLEQIIRKGDGVWAALC